MPDSQLRPFAGASVGLESATTETGGAEEMKYSILRIGDIGGAVYFLNEHWSVEGTLHLNMISYTEDDSHAVSEDMDSLTTSLTLGIVFSF